MIAPKKIFGTDGVRGTANVEPVTAETALKLGRAAGYVFKNLESQSRGRGKHKIVIGKDTRLSGYMLENAISAGILSMGVDVLFIGPLPTPGVAYVTRSLRADAGIVITASHNPYDDNGIKFFRADGYKLDDRVEARIEELVFGGDVESLRPKASEVGKAVRIDDALGRYIEYAKASFPRGMTLEGMRIVVDCAHGAAYKSTPCVLRELGAQVIVYGNQPDGTNINKDCGSMHPEQMCQKVREHGAQLGIAHDGDADRVLLCDETGTLIDGDDIMAIAGLDMLERGSLAHKTLVSTVMSNAGLDKAIESKGGKMLRTPVGDKNVIDEMLRHGYSFGGEQSGHMIFGEHSTTGDGLVCALQILQIMKAKERPLSKLAKCWTRYPQLVTNVKVREKKPFEQMNGVLQLVASAEAEVKPSGGRVLLRYSGTEPKARLLIEGPDAVALERLSESICDAIRKQVGA
ncbi:phosphoglucosamine mutase [Pedosphaera parvula]|uniref:Phosphoglucosamine mutase n=1 Tax=Pedosphaera parvula (strain Ellin514) TaxID=320771 RepID=B9XBN0_PEDPL|nr:phosphoglucosamine mutase [Pedosphaera parvula]EEF62915.1 phosphoglucosamine mutase [Pedosphaera parvula Ellin514]